MKRDEIVNSSRRDGGMFAVIPSVVMQDPALPMSAKMLYGVITWRCGEAARCWATNRTLGEELGLSPKRISVLIAGLEEQGHIETEIVRDPETGAVRTRYIYPVVKSSRKPGPPPKSGDTPPPKNEDTSPHTRGDPPPENGEDIYEKYKDKRKDTPYSPPQGDEPTGKGRRRGPKQVPAWKPERFEGFWRTYPVKKSKQAAIRAWDKLRPDDSLLAVMGRALMRQLASEDWQRGFGIPYPATWLNGRRWEDESGPPDVPAGQAGGGSGDCGWR